MLIVIYVLTALTFGGGAAAVVTQDFEPGQMYAFGNESVDKFGNTK